MKLLPVLAVGPWSVRDRRVLTSAAAGIVDLSFTGTLLPGGRQPDGVPHLALFSSVDAAGHSNADLVAELRRRVPAIRVIVLVMPQTGVPRHIRQAVHAGGEVLCVASGTELRGWLQKTVATARKIRT